ncbi:hypothetical protein CCY99_00020 [Helicobacter sp. 16-1353]|uniref:DUF4156 domain-containing protein n=1 Tax=Helicobacter sp. 16-1353 TaxID=2004996 RepID=UPI000DCE1BEC|nr:DUF4156 domain-containing protein [Helicobacter sp. 16-1353]RAX55122.1 hypothetical protein CCY99_00020 [Helicobacter sp. 16-1353]
MKSILLVLLSSFLFIGCAGTINALDSNARFVRIVTTEPPDTCAYLGEVYGYQENTHSFNESLVTEGAINDAKNKAYKLGGDTMYFLSNQNKITINSRGNKIILDNNPNSTQEVNIVALVYKCK